MEQRRRVQGHARRGALKVLREPLGDGQQRVQAGDDRTVREHHRLGEPGAARGEQDQGGLVLVAAVGAFRQGTPGLAGHGPRRDGGAGGQFGRQPAVGEHGPGLQQRKGVLDLTGAPPRVDQDRDGPQPQGRPDVDDPVRPVPPQQRDAVPGTDPVLLQLGRLAADSAHEAGEIEPEVALHHMGPARPAAGVVQQGRQAPRAGFVHAVGDAAHLLDRDLAPPLRGSATHLWLSSLVVVGVGPQSRWPPARRTPSATLKASPAAGRPQ